MPDFVTLDPKDFTVEELLNAARNENIELKPQVAIGLLRLKLGDAAEGPLTEVATDESLDPRSRQAAALALALFPTSRDVLTALATSSQELVAVAARQALEG